LNVDAFFNISLSFISGVWVVGFGYLSEISLDSAKTDAFLKLRFLIVV